MEIRQVSAEERPEALFALHAYAFGASPWSDDDAATYQRLTGFHRDTVSLVAEEHGEALAGVAAIPMRQNVRGVVYPMAGIASVSSHPVARRRGLVRRLLDRLLRQMRDAGHPVSALYPFRPSFYERFGYVGLPRRRTATLAPEGLAHLLRAELPGTVTRQDYRQGFDEHRALTVRLLGERHGFAVFPDRRAAMLPQAHHRWVAVARCGAEVVGAVTYRIDRHGGDLVADDLLATGPLGRALLLQFLARHVDQVAQVVVTVGAHELPELWGTDLTVRTVAEVAFPGSAAPMARVLDLTALAGMPVGRGGATVEVVGDELTAGRYRLDGDAGRLAVSRSAAEPVARLTTAGLSGLVYGVLDPVDVVVRGFGQVDAAAVDALRALFPRRLPYVFSEF